jgi:hypothetical protein
MSRTRKDAKRGGHRQRHISAHGVLRLPPDLNKMSRAAIRIAMEQAAIEKAAEASAKSTADGKRQEPHDV